MKRALSSPTDKTTLLRLSGIALMDDETLATNRRLEQSLNTQANSHTGISSQPINLVNANVVNAGNAVDDATQTAATHSMAMPDTMLDTMTAAITAPAHHTDTTETTPTSPPHTTSAGEVSVKKPSKGWLIAMIAALIAGLVAIGGYGVSTLKSASTPTTSQSATSNQSDNTKAASSDDNSQKKPKSQTKSQNSIPKYFILIFYKLWYYFYLKAYFTEIRLKKRAFLI